MKSKDNVNNDSVSESTKKMEIDGKEFLSKDDLLKMSTSQISRAYAGNRKERSRKAGNLKRALRKDKKWL